MNSESVPNDEIDIRPILQTLWKNKWWIIGATLVLGGLAFIASKFILPETYDAKAYVIFTKPSTTVNLNPNIQSSPQIPDAKSLSDLMLTDDLVDAVMQDPEVAELFPDPITTDSFRNMLKQSLIGNNQISLKVTDKDPTRAAMIVNVWARNVAQRLNDLFGSGSMELTSLQQQADQAQADWETAQQALLAYMKDSDVETLKVNLEGEKQAQAALLRKINDIDLVISDAQALMARIAAQNASNSISLEDALSLITLTQLASGKLENFQVQLAGEMIPGQDTSVSEARKNLDTLINVLQAQQEEIQAQFESKTEQITSLSTQIEENRYNINLLSVQRDLSQKAYEALSSHQVEIQILSSTEDQVAQVAGEALPPTKPSSPNTPMITLIGIAFGFIIATGFVLVFSWWKSSE